MVGDLQSCFHFRRCTVCGFSVLGAVSFGSVHHCSRVGLCALRRPVGCVDGIYYVGSLSCPLYLGSDISRVCLSWVPDCGSCDSGVCLSYICQFDYGFLLIIFQRTLQELALIDSNVDHDFIWDPGGLIGLLFSHCLGTSSFIMGLPKAQGCDCIYVVVDRLTKYAHFFPITTTLTTVQVAEVFFREIFRLYGIPRSIVSDRDSRFLSHCWQEVFRLCGTELTPSTSYHPQSDRQTEIVNKWVEGYLRNYVAGQQKAWVRWIYLCEYCYNPTYHMSIQMTPFRALYGYEAPSFLDLLMSDVRVLCVGDVLQESKDIVDALRDNIARAQNQHKQYADQKRTIREYLVKWRDLLEEDATWEGKDILLHPALRLLEGKQFQEGRTVMSPF